MESKQHAISEEEDKSTGTGTHSSLGLGSDFDSRPLTNIELIRKAEDCVDKLKLEKAVALYDEGLRRWPNDTLIID